MGIQREAAGRGARRAGAGRPLEPGVAARMRPLLGADVSHARVHSDELGARIAERHGAAAVAVGSHVAFARGTYEPGTPLGDALIAHELAHVAQYDETAVVAPAREAEREADAAGVAALAQRGVAALRRSVEVRPRAAALRQQGVADHPRRVRQSAGEGARGIRSRRQRPRQAAGGQPRQGHVALQLRRRRRSGQGAERGDHGHGAPRQRRRQAGQARPRAELLEEPARAGSSCSPTSTRAAARRASQSATSPTASARRRWRSRSPSAASSCRSSPPSDSRRRSGIASTLDDPSGRPRVVGDRRPGDQLRLPARDRADQRGLHHLRSQP